MQLKLLNDINFLKNVIQSTEDFFTIYEETNGYILQKCKEQGFLPPFNALTDLLQYAYSKHDRQLYSLLLFIKHNYELNEKEESILKNIVLEAENKRLTPKEEPIPKNSFMTENDLQLLFAKQAKPSDYSKHIISIELLNKHSDELKEFTKIQGDSLADTIKYSLSYFKAHPEEGQINKVNPDLFDNIHYIRILSALDLLQEDSPFRNYYKDFVFNLEKTISYDYYCENYHFSTEEKGLFNELIRKGESYKTLNYKWFSTTKNRIGSTLKNIDFEDKYDYITNTYQLSNQDFTEQEVKNNIDFFKDIYTKKLLSTKNAYSQSKSILSKDGFTYLLFDKEVLHTILSNYTSHNRLLKKDENFIKYLHLINDRDTTYTADLAKILLVILTAYNNNEIDDYVSYEDIAYVIKSLDTNLNKYKDCFNQLSDNAYNDFLKEIETFNNQSLDKALENVSDNFDTVYSPLNDSLFTQALSYINNSQTIYKNVNLLLFLSNNYTPNNSYDILYTIDNLISTNRIAVNKEEIDNFFVELDSILKTEKTGRRAEDIINFKNTLKDHCKNIPLLKSREIDSYSVYSYKDIDNYSDEKIAFLMFHKADFAKYILDNKLTIPNSALIRIIHLSRKDDEVFLDIFAIPYLQSHKEDLTNEVIDVINKHSTLSRLNLFNKQINISNLLDSFTQHLKEYHKVVKNLSSNQYKTDQSTFMCSFLTNLTDEQISNHITQLLEQEPSLITTLTEVFRCTHLERFIINYFNKIDFDKLNQLLDNKDIADTIFSFINYDNETDISFNFSTEENFKIAEKLYSFTEDSKYKYLYLFKNQDFIKSFVIKYLPQELFYGYDFIKSSVSPDKPLVNQKYTTQDFINAYNNFTKEASFFSQQGPNSSYTYSLEAFLEQQDDILAPLEKFKSIPEFYALFIACNFSDFGNISELQEKNNKNTSISLIFNKDNSSSNRKNREPKQLRDKELSEFFNTYFDFDLILEGLQSHIDKAGKYGKQSINYELINKSIRTLLYQFYYEISEDNSINNNLSKHNLCPEVITKYKTALTLDKQEKLINFLYKNKPLYLMYSFDTLSCDLVLNTLKNNYNLEDHGFLDHLLFDNTLVEANKYIFTNSSIKTFVNHLMHKYLDSNSIESLKYLSYLFQTCHDITAEDPIRIGGDSIFLRNEPILCSRLLNSLVMDDDGHLNDTTENLKSIIESHIISKGTENIKVKQNKKLKI